MKALDLTDQTHGTFQVIARDANRKRYWTARCTLCKKVSSHRQDALTAQTARCTCNDGRIIHGDAGKHDRDPLHVLWSNMRQRVRSQAYTYPLELEPEWAPAGRGYKEFRQYILTTIGRRTSERHSLDRVNVFGGYVKGNLRWADDAEQADNRTTTKPIKSPEYRAALTAREWAQYLNQLVGSADYWTRERVELLRQHLTIEQIISAVHPQRRTPQDLVQAQRQAVQTQQQREADEAFADWEADM